MPFRTSWGPSCAKGLKCAASNAGRECSAVTAQARLYASMTATRKMPCPRRGATSCGVPYLGLWSTLARDARSFLGRTDAAARHSSHTRAPSPAVKSYRLSTCVRGDQSRGGKTQRSIGKRVGCTISTHPISATFPPRNRMRSLMPVIRLCISANEEHPFAMPKVSHASQSGRREYRAKYPKPQIALYGARSLKMKGENSGARVGRVADGFQKLTSSSTG